MNLITEIFSLLLISWGALIVSFLLIFSIPYLLSWQNSFIPGMIGTLIGLVQMLSNMSDPQSIGPAMAVAMLTTLYGAILANMIALPIADKLELRSKQEQLNKSMMIDAIMGIQKGQNPRVIKDMLNTYLPGSKRQDEGGKDDTKKEK